jgi:hypothetical protein
MLFVLFLAGLDLALGAICGRVFARQTTGASGGLANRAIAEHAPLLMLGSSRAQHHLDPEILGAAAGLRAWNAGADGQGLYYACSLLDLVEAEAVPRLVIWSLDRKDFDPKQRPSQLQRLSVLLPHYPESPRLREFWNAQGYEARLKVQVRTYRFNSLVLPMLASLWSSSAEGNGFVPIPAREGGPPAFAEGEVYASPDQRALAALAGALSLLSARGSTVVLLTTPRWSPGDPPAAFYDAVDGEVERRVSGLPRVVFWRMDEAALPAFRDAALFADAGHLNAEGARRFSTRIAERLRAEIRPRLGSVPTPGS